jgi:glutamyl-tRNA reductase
MPVRDIFMNLIYQGVDFKNCSAAASPKLVLDQQQQKSFLHNCCGYSQISDALVLNTCNRLEFYFYAKKQFDISVFIDDFISSDCWNRYKHTFYGLDVAKHLFNVAAGLESQIIGENEIFSQLKSAYSFALRYDTVKSVFHHLLHSAFRVAKAVRTHTDINTGALSIAQAAVELAADNFAVEGAKVFVIGSGLNAGLVVKHLVRKNVRDITIVARNPVAAQQLIEKAAAGHFLPLSKLEDCLSDADIVFTAAASQRSLITVAKLQKRIKPLIFIDLSVPPNVEPDAGKLDRVKLFNIDSLNEIISENNRKRQAQIPKARLIIDRHLQAFSERFAGLSIVPLVAEKAAR